MWSIRTINLPLMIGALGIVGYIVMHPIPGTGALRTLSLFLCILYLAFRWRLPANTEGLISGRPLLCLVALITIWMGARSAYLSQGGEPYLDTFLREWGKLLFVGFLGAGMTLKAPYQEARVLFVAVFVGFFVHVLATLAFQPWGWMTQRHLVLGLSVLGNYGYVSPLVDAALAVLLADIVQRVISNNSILPVTNKWLATLLSLTLAASLLLAAKSSAIVTLVLSIFFVLIIFISKSKRRKVVLFATVGILLTAALLSLRLENRWQNVTESVAYAMDVDNNRGWATGSYSEARPDIDGSFYLRAAWLKIAILGIAEHPLGLGYSSNAFGRHVEARYGVPNAISSHSGWADFALANGLPGLALLLAIGATFAVKSWCSFKVGGNVGGLSMAFLSIGFYCRGLLDGHFSTSRLAGFVLVMGLLWGLMRRGVSGRQVGGMAIPQPSNKA